MRVTVKVDEDTTHIWLNCLLQADGDGEVLIRRQPEGESYWETAAVYRKYEWAKQE